MNIDQLTVAKYLEKMAETSFPGPSSGSAAGTAAAMAAALLEMSCEVTMKKDAQQSNLAEVLNEIKGIRKDCLFLASEDIKAYDVVVKATKAKKEFPDQYDTAMKAATDTLVSIVKNSETILKRIDQVIKTCFIKVWGDLAGGTCMAEAAAAAAKQGVDINLRLLHDEAYKEKVQNMVNMSYKNCLEAKNRILATRSF